MPRPADPDWQLLAAHRAGDPHAFAALMTRHHGWLWPFIQRRARTWALGAADEVAFTADDVWQETWWRVHQAAHRVREEHRFAAWVRTIADNVMKNIVRAQRRRPRRFTAATAFLEEALESPERGAEAVTEDADLRRLLVRALHAVCTPLQRRIILARVVQQRHYRDIAQAVGLSINATRRHAHLAKQALRDYINAQPAYARIVSPSVLEDDE